MSSIGDQLTGVLAGRGDLETWTPESPELAHSAIVGVATFCRDYCPSVNACVEDACRLWRLEQRASDVLAPPNAADTVGVVGQPILGTL